ELARGRGAELELPAGEVSWLRSPPRGQHRPDRPVTLARHAMARDASHRVDVAADDDALGMFPGNMRALVARVGVLVGHECPPLLNRELSLPRGHGCALTLDRLDPPSFAHPPERA